MAEVWIADDDNAVRYVLESALGETGARVRAFADAESLLVALDAAAPTAPDVIISDVRMPGEGGLKLLERLKARHCAAPVVIMSAFTDVASTAAAYRNGAFDYLPKPFDLDVAVAAVERAIAENRPVPAPLPPSEPEQDLVGQSASMRAVFRSIGRVAATNLNVLITGETGTGKELVARALHRHSARAQKPFVALNTAAIPTELLESELFGHEAGAFTGAARRHQGRFEQAMSGSLFLDEIGDMPLSLQTRLLRVLAESEFYRVGGRELIHADVRVVAATHQDLDAKVEQGSFRADLLHRLDVVRLHLPALRERREDIPLLASRFLARAAQSMQLDAKYFSPAALGALAELAWPGNVRQLENLCRRLAVTTTGREIRVGDLPAAKNDGNNGADEKWTTTLAQLAREQLRGGRRGVYAALRGQFDKTMLDAAIAENGGQRGRAAEQLGVGRNTLTRKLGSSRARGKGKST